MMKAFTGILMLILTFLLINSCKDQAVVLEPDPTHKAPALNLHKKAVGESAYDLLSSDQYKFMQVEIQYIEGYSPTQAALDNMKTFLIQRLNKPRGIQFIYSALKSPHKSSYSVSEIDVIENNHRTVYTKGDTIGVYFFFADAGYNMDTQNSKVLGIAFKNTSMALFQKTIHDLSGGINQPDRSKLETVVLNHEFCHILGLVNVGTPLQTPHQDEDASHGKHCNNSKCLMHYTVETGNVVTNLLGGSMPQLDANCIEDLRANGGK